MCWQAAGAIHTDFERGFICAEVMHYDELHELGSEAAVKAAGKYRQEVSTRKLSSQSCLFAYALISSQDVQAALTSEVHRRSSGQCRKRF